MLYCKTELLQIEREQAEVFYCKPAGTSSRATLKRTKEEGGQDTTHGAIERPREDIYCKTQLVPLWREQGAVLYCKTEVVLLHRDKKGGVLLLNTTRGTLERTRGCVVLQNRSCFTTHTETKRGVLL